MSKFKTIDQYIASFPASTQEVLKKMHKVIRAEMPDNVEEVISYNIPCFNVNGKYVIYFAGWKEHVSIYPILDADELRAEIEPYVAGRGTLKFPLNKPIPYDLIGRIAKLRLTTN